MLQDDTHGAVKNNNDDADAGEEDGLLAGNENPLLQYRTNNVNIPRKKDV